MIVILIGLGSGLMVGCGFVAFLTVLGIVPRLTQLSKSDHLVQYYEWAIVLGVVLGTWTELRNIVLHLGGIISIPIGLFSGIFVGMLAAALTEVVNVIPIFAKRIGIDGQLISALMAIVLGKVVGSLFQWIYFVNH
ncbi:stage V sporulation protein AB [Bacillus ginsengihumi]|uniref:Stage V sporulation protein AB n=2 Tax=Heyndrickxia ginsengihumi TaxID=363870 RepID=A0A0A6VC76_9BACI|nr:stage V sporulation protein AB [Heyndrickxia ginsengihumi]KHD85825.1 stage V sporulation protein AB [Heyndrickxia ginsengihumi]MBE6184605.1 stage V sporulation protein AB [Bacillus sp. (in: firmicutes)]NEY20700.1 stage V sporulation protein AB [Heyndrickxia ginsengihumi]